MRPATASRVVQTKPSNKRVRVTPVGRKAIYSRSKENASQPRSQRFSESRRISPSQTIPESLSQVMQAPLAVEPTNPLPGSRIHYDYEVGSPNTHKELWVPKRYAEVPIARLERPEWPRYPPMIDPRAPHIVEPIALPTRENSPLRERGKIELGLTRSPYAKDTGEFKRKRHAEAERIKDLDNKF